MAADVARVLEQHGFQSTVIGAVALAVRGYPRATTDLDLATLVYPQTLVELRKLAKALRARGYQVELVDADAPEFQGDVRAVCRELGLEAELDAVLGRS